MNNFIIDPNLLTNLRYFKSFGVIEPALQKTFNDIREGADLITINKEKDVKNSNFKDLDKFLLTGIDIPILLKSMNESSRKKVFIIGSEPLRNWTYFNSKNLNVYNDIALNTPFSIHQTDGHTTLYGKIITKFLETHDVYLTDIRKIWFAGFNYHNDFLNDSIHSNFLKEEFEAFSDIDHFITFGKDSFGFTKKLLNDDPRVKYFIHPSRRTLGNQRKAFFAKHNINIENCTTQEEPYLKLVTDITAITAPKPH